GHTASYYLAYTYLQKKNAEYAYNTFSMAAGVDFDKTIQAESIYNMAKLDYEAHRFSEAIAKIKQLQKDFKGYKFPEPEHRILTEAYLNNNNLDEAIAYIEAIKYPTSRINDIYKEVTYLKGVNYFNQKNYKEANSSFTKSLKTKGDTKFDFKARFWRAECYSINYQWDKALNDYAYVFKAGEKHELYRQARYGAGYAYFNQRLNEKGLSELQLKQANKKKYTSALGHFKFYVDHKKTKGKDNYIGDATLRLADCYYKLKDYDKALKFYDDAILLGSKNAAYAYYQKGIVNGLKTNFSKASKDFDMVIKKYPNSVYVEEAMYMKALNYYEVGQYGKSIPLYSAYLAKFNSSVRTPLVLLERGVANINTKKYGDALKDFDKVLFEYCTDTVLSSQALKGCHQSLIALNKNEEYDKRLQQFFKCGGQGQERLFFEKAQANYNAKKYELAIKNLEEFLVSYPNSVFSYEANYLLGMAYYEKSNLPKAIEYLNVVAEDDKKYHFNEALIILSEIYKDQWEWEKANKVNEQLLSITLSEQQKQMILLNLVVGSYEVKDYDACLGYAEEVLQSEDRLVYASNKASLYKGLAYYHKGELNKASDEFVLLSNNSKDIYGAQAHFMVGQVQYDQQKYVEALETVKVVLKMRKDFQRWYGEAYILASLCYVQQGEELQGKSYLKNVVKHSKNEQVVAHAKKVLEELENKVEAE
ncbi:tetratricopeptide repeat protein, partial [Cyclobacteriaceae bacterium]|nr:tetratricopeptide repeat protein [Cyclobacteriaceae bacterium]